MLETKTITSLFEGVERLKQRTNRITSQMLTSEQLKNLQDSADSLISKVSEGEEAVLKLKGLELGNSVKSRLVNMMELHAATRGGLDGMIATALTTISNKAETIDQDLKLLITSLQSTANSTSQSTNEALLTLLSQRSVYREMILLKLEHTLLDIDDQLQSIFGTSLNIKTILDVVTSQQNTSAIFDPITKKITVEILAQLDELEKTIEHPAALSVISHIRTGVSASQEGDGEESKGGMGNPIDKVMTVLNDDSTVAIGQNMVERGEQILDSIETTTKSKQFGSIVSSVRQAGINEDTLINSLQQINVDEIINNVDDLVNNEQARRNMIAGAADSALEFLLKVLPSVEIPKLSGVKDGNMYSIADLSMNGFMIKKEDIDVQIAGISTNAYANSKTPPTLTPNVSFTSKEMNPSEIPLPPSSSQESSSSFPSASAVPPAPPSIETNLKELLVIRVSNIQARLEDIKWSFEQTYFPHMKGKGTANAVVVNASLLLKFELRKKRKDPSAASITSTTSFEPVLCLNDRDCTIERMKVDIKGDSLSWLYNMLASLFKNLLKEYVTKTVVEAISDSSGYLLETLNENLAMYWPLILKMSDFSVDDLEEVDESAITDTSQIAGKDIVELVWREPVPLGMKLLMNDGSGEVKVVEFPRGGQALRVAEAAELDPNMFKGATICGVNGRKFVDPPSSFSRTGTTTASGPVDMSKIQVVIAALKEPGRPKSIEFLISDTERTRIMRVLGKLQESEKKDDNIMVRKVPKEINDVVITQEGPLGLSLGVIEEEVGLVVLGFKEGKENKEIKVGSVLVCINGTYVQGGEDFVTRATEMFKEVGGVRPIELGFMHPCAIAKRFGRQLPSSVRGAELSEDAFQMYGSPSEELVLVEARMSEEDKYTSIVISGFKDAPGALECGTVQCGDVLMSVNAVPFFISKTETEMKQRKKLWSLINQEDAYPMTFEFARPRPGVNGVDGKNFFSTQNSTRFAVEVHAKSDLGVSFRKTAFGNDEADAGAAAKSFFKNFTKGDQPGRGSPSEGFTKSEAIEFLQVSSLNGVKGPVRCAMQESVKEDERIGLGMALIKINGHAVPQSASAEDVSRALERAWRDSKEGCLDVIFKDYAHQDFVLGLKGGGEEVRSP